MQFLWTQIFVLATEGLNFGTSTRRAYGGRSVPIFHIREHIKVDAIEECKLMAMKFGERAFSVAVSQACHQNSS